MHQRSHRVKTSGPKPRVGTESGVALADERDGIAASSIRILIADDCALGAAQPARNCDNDRNGGAFLKPLMGCRLSYEQQNCAPTWLFSICECLV